MSTFYIIQDNKIVNKIIADNINSVSLKEGQSIYTSSQSLNNNWVYSSDNDTFSPPLLGGIDGENVWYSGNTYVVSGSVETPEGYRETGSFIAENDYDFYIYTGSYNLKAKFNHPIVSFNASNITSTNSELTNISKVDDKTYSFTLQPSDEITGSLNEEEIKIHFSNLTDANNSINVLSSQYISIGYSSSLYQYEEN